MFEELVSFELAKLIHESYIQSIIESDLECMYAVSKEGYDSALDFTGEYFFDVENILDAQLNTDKEYYLAPTLSLVQKWLREKYNTYVGVSPIIYAGEEKAEGFQATLNNSTILYKSRFDSYEEALENGIVFYLKSQKDVK